MYAVQLIYYYIYLAVHNNYCSVKPRHVLGGLGQIAHVYQWSHMHDQYLKYAIRVLLLGLLNSGP